MITLKKQNQEPMDNLLNTNLLHIRIYLFVKRIIRIVQLFSLLAFGYLVARMFLHEEYNNLELLGIIAILLIIFEIIIRCYKWFNKKFLDELQELIAAETLIKKETSENYERMLNDYLAAGESQLLSDDTKALIEKEKTGDGFVSLQLLKARIEYNMAITHQRKLDKLYRLLEKKY